MFARDAIGVLIEAKAADRIRMVLAVFDHGSGLAEQHKFATQMLLNHSSYRVHTHDFRH